MGETWGSMPVEGTARCANQPQRNAQAAARCTPASHGAIGVAREMNTRSVRPLSRRINVRWRAK